MLTARWSRSIRNREQALLALGALLIEARCAAAEANRAAAALLRHRLAPSRRPAYARPWRYADAAELRTGVGGIRPCSCAWHWRPLFLAHQLVKAAEAAGEGVR